MELNEKEQKKYEIIEKVVNNEISKKDAENQLSFSRKQINRLITIFKEQERKDLFIKVEAKQIQIKKPPIS